ncbi:hypothetical protein PM082_014437 [Marasmius tenuissimus]|nr:hypothetical protein PM082_014437 [Marasmius tenuissimus]
MPRYHLHATLVGLRDAVLSLSISVQAKFIIVTGYGGVSIWSTDTLNPVAITTPYVCPGTSEPKFLISVSKWLFFEQSSRHVLLLGAISSDISAWHWNDSLRTWSHTVRNITTEQVLSMDIHRSNINTNDMAYVTMSHADRTVSVWTLSSVGQFNKIFNIQIQPPFKIPQSVKFDEYRNVNVFAGGGGMIVKLDRQTGAVVTQRVISKLDESRMGSVALNEARDQLIVNTSNTCEVFTFSDLKHRATLPSTAPTVVTYPRQMTLIEDGSRLVSGTDSGHAVVYNLDRYTVEQKLVYPKGGLVQPVASFGDEAWTYIVIAGLTGE